MKSFINLKTGVIETPNNSMVIEQYEKNIDLYEEYKPTKSENADKELTLRELKEQADALGLTYAKKVTKAELIEMIVNANQE